MADGNTSSDSSGDVNTPVAPIPLDPVTLFKGWRIGLEEWAMPLQFLSPLVPMTHKGQV